MGNRTGGGSYEPPNREQSKKDLRNHFLAAVSEYAKYVIEDLSSEPFKLYLEAGLGFKVAVHKSNHQELSADERARREARELPRRNFSRPEWQRNFENSSLAYNPRKEAFRQSLFEWSRRNHLDAAWCRERAYETLDDWSYSLPIGEDLHFQPLVKLHKLFSTGRKVERFVFECAVSHPQLKPLEEIEAELRKKFERQLKIFLRQYDTRAKEQGYVPTPKEYESKYSEDRFRWLVEWVVNGKSFQSIIEENNDGSGGPDYSTVRKTLIELANAIELPYPPAKKS
jgi:hypothetical protein